MPDEWKCSQVMFIDKPGKESVKTNILVVYSGKNYEKNNQQKAGMVGGTQLQNLP